jgi:hypothetical protein
VTDDADLGAGRSGPAAHFNMPFHLSNMRERRPRTAADAITDGKDPMVVEMPFMTGDFAS